LLGIHLHMQWMYGVSECTTWPWPFERDLERYRALGAGAIEMWEFKLATDAGRRREQVQAAARQYDVSSFQATVHSLFPTHTQPEPSGLQERRTAFVQTLREVAPYIPGAVFVLNTGAASRGDVQAAFDATVCAYRELVREARDAGVLLALEPLHPLQMNEDTFAWNLEDAMDVIDAVGDDALGICADAWNLAGQHDLQSRLARCGDRIFIAQVSDYRRPRSFLDRLPLGDGSLDLRPFLLGLEAANYRGPLVFELFSKDVSDSFYDGDMEAGIVRTRERLSGLCATVPSA